MTTSRPLNLVLCALFVLAAGPARASLVAREDVTLGTLCDRADAAVIARVAAVTPSEVSLVVERALKGRPGAALTLPAGPVAFGAGERALVFLQRDRSPTGRRAGAWHALRSPYQKAVAPDAAAAAELADAVASRRATLGGDPRRLFDALFDQLSARLARVREDAAWDLVGLGAYQPDAAQRRALRLALDAGANEPLLVLAARWPAADLLGAALLAAQGQDPLLRRRAAEALEAIDPLAALRRVRADIQQPDPARAARAVALAGALGSASTPVLASALLDARAEVRREALSALSRRELSPVEVSALAQHTYRATSFDEAARALAALALRGEAQALLDAERRHPDPATRDLARELRAAPVLLSRRLLAD
ncbi:MAG: hypothetical protein AB7N76_35440 [Planctomycetota bacterium]